MARSTSSPSRRRRPGSSGRPRSRASSTRSGRTRPRTARSRSSCARSATRWSRSTSRTPRARRSEPVATLRPRLGPVSRRRLGENLAGWLCTAPWMIGFLVFTAGPMLASAGIATTDWDLIASPRFVGLANFQRAVLVDPAVWTALRVTTTYAAVSVPLQLGFGLALALLLNARVRGQSIYRTIYYLPAVLSG